MVSRSEVEFFFRHTLTNLVVSIFVISLIVPSNDEELSNGAGDASASPFVIAARRSGITVIPSIINAGVLTSAWSAGNSGK